MTTQNRRNESTAPLYLALDLGGSTWKSLSAVRLGAKPRGVSIAAGDLAALKAESASAPADGLAKWVSSRWRAN